MATAVRALAADRAPYALYGVKCIDLVPLALFSGEFAIVNLPWIWARGRISGL
jgi:hypothetical protein